MRWRHRRNREQDLERELPAHLDAEAAEQREAGLSASQAWSAARRSLGDAALIQARRWLPVLLADCSPASWPAG